jgi:hypothetical protein
VSVSASCAARSSRVSPNGAGKFSADVIRWPHLGAHFYRAKILQPVDAALICEVKEPTRGGRIATTILTPKENI